ncbi:e3 ubiquitin-protein ligase [Anaeramoeba flamelloides]|uniref:E3 ubiquitin-protein ligase RNF170 n=1 Tax=Anaeramoeba flamelloides TaxID=1746091 RepID=A0AAV7YJL8_9EUKA|nr:e3 ubiquitin-protein ligase [Anaeramoeba flamelloides]KAJ6254056.1 e3 ubiquitin-protein ligase [Anaeramoeba flamelloides]
MNKNFQCPICYEEIEYCVSCNCGHNFCCECILSYVEIRRSKCCPKCSTPVYRIFPNNKIRHSISTSSEKNNEEISEEDKIDFDKRLQRYNNNHTKPKLFSPLIKYNYIMFKQLLLKGAIDNKYSFLSWLLLIILVAYLLIPFDLIPITLGFVGIIDDLILLVWCLFAFHYVIEYYEKFLLKNTEFVNNQNNR